MTEEYTPTKSDGGKPDAFSYEALVNPHDTDIVPGQHEAFGPMGNTSEKTREVVEYDPNTIPVITTEQISAIDDRLNQFFDEQYDHTVPAAETDRMLAEIVDGMLTEAGIDPTIRRSNGSAIVRVRGEDGKEMPRAIGLGGRDFGVHDTTIKIVEAPHKQDPIEQESVAEEDKAERVDDALEDVDEALAQPDIEESVPVDKNNEEPNPNQDEEKARKERELQDALEEEKKSLDNYENTLADIARNVANIGDPERLLEGRRRLYSTVSQLEETYSYMGKYGRLPNSETVQVLIQDVSRLKDFISTDIQDTEAAVVNAQSQSESRDRVHGDIMPKLVGEGTKDHVHRLKSGVDAILENLGQQLPSQLNEAKTVDRTVHDIQRVLNDMLYNGHHGQGVDVYVYQLSPAINRLKQMAESRAGKAHRLEELHVQARQLETQVAV